MALGALTHVTIGGTTCVKAYTNPVKLGDTLVVFAAIGASATTVTVTDSLNLQWQTASLAGVSVAQYAFFAVVTTAGTPTITITTASTDIAMALYEIEGAGGLDLVASNSSNGTGAAPSLTCLVTQENELGFFCIAAEAGTISAASPNSPASSVFDTGNIVVAGSSNLKNFGVFSAPFGAPINTTSVSGNQTNTFKAALSGSVVYSNLCFAFRPAAVQVNASGSIVATASVSSTTASAVAQTAVTSTSSSILAANAARLECTVVNTGVVAVYLGLNGKTPTSANYHIALSACGVANDGTGGTYTSDLVKGAINAITASTSGTVCVTELTA